MIEKMKIYVLMPIGGNHVNDYDGLDIDLKSIDRVIGGITGSGYSFNDNVHRFMETDTMSVFQSIYENAANVFSSELSGFRSLFARMIIIIILSAVFINLSKTFKNKQVSETGFYVTYMLIFMIFATSFGSLFDLSGNVMNNLLTFMKALIPTFFMTVTYVAGSGSTAVFYQAMIALLGLVQALIVNVFLPLINTYFVFSAVNPLMEEDYFSHFLELIEKIVTWGLKTIFTVTMGVGLIQSLIVPAAAGVRKSIIGKTVNAIPAVGGTMSTVFESVFGAGMIIKNAIGAAGLVTVVMICIVPVAKLGIHSLLYQFCAAVSQPIANDKRILRCITSASKSVRLLLVTVGMSAVLFMVTIALVSASTGIGY